MLEPRDRRLLLDSLRPPFGYTLDHALGTTFSLDLLALLTAPLAFTLFDADAALTPADEDGRPADPLALLLALRRQAGRISLFCQAGRIIVPARHQLLFSYLESSVFEAAAPDPAYAFHPKLWLLRFTAPESPVRYRLLCMSRNLTFDRSWDTVLVLDGELLDRRNAFAANHPLGNLVAALPELVVRRPLPPARLEAISQMADEVRRVRFDPPPGFERVAFWPLVVSGNSGWPFQGRMDRLLVVSPFVSAGCLQRLAAQAAGSVLVSRPESLAPLPADELARFDRVYYLSPQADPEEDSQEGAQAGSADTLAGLHAKLYLADAGWQARIWTGSANATDAAFGGNVEFLVELEGKKSQCGIETFLGSGDGPATFAGLLQEYLPNPDGIPVDEEQESLERLIERGRSELSGAGLRAVLSLRDPGNTFRLRITLPAGRTLELPAGLTGTCWPISLPEATERSLGVGPTVVADFEAVSYEAITPFFAFSLLATAATRNEHARFVLSLPLEGAPEDRSERLLRSLLNNRDQVLRLLRFLLADGDADSYELLVGTGRPGEAHNTGNVGFEFPLLEALIRALHRQPGRLDEVARLVDELTKTSEGKDLLPPGLEAIWPPIRDVYQRRKR